MNRHWAGLGLLLVSFLAGMWGYGSAYYDITNLALVGWMVGAVLTVHSPLERGLSGFEAAARWWRLVTLAVLPPVLLLFALPSWQSGLATFRGNIYATEFQVPFYSDARSLTGLELLRDLGWLNLTVLIGGWPLVLMSSFVLTAAWVIKLPTLERLQKLQWLSYGVVFSLSLFVIAPAVGNFMTWFID